MKPENAPSETEAASQRVLLAAATFGKDQGDAAADWVAKAISLDPNAPRDSKSLMSSQLMFFEECLLDDDDGGAKCKELDVALTELEASIEGLPQSHPSKQLRFGENQLDRAGARLLKAAAKFGPKRQKVAADWIKKTRYDRNKSRRKAAKGGKTVPLAKSESLLAEQLKLFGECLLDESGSNMKCIELEDALTALRAALGEKLTPEEVLKVYPPPPRPKPEAEERVPEAAASAKASSLAEVSAQAAGATVEAKVMARETVVLTTEAEVEEEREVPKEVIVARAEARAAAEAAAAAAAFSAANPDDLPAKSRAIGAAYEARVAAAEAAKAEELAH